MRDMGSLSRVSFCITRNMLRSRFASIAVSSRGFFCHFFFSTKEFLDFVHEPSCRLHDFLPNPEVEHEKVGSLLRAIKKKNIPIFIFSNAPKAHVDRILVHFGLDIADLWDGYLYYDNMRAQSKPNEGAYTMAMEMIRQRVPDIQPEEVLFFDDSKPNLAASKKFGIGYTPHSFSPSLFFSLLRRLTHLFPIGIKNCWVRGGGANGELDADESVFIDYLIEDIRHDSERVLRIFE